MNASSLISGCYDVLTKCLRRLATAEAQKPLPNTHTALPVVCEGAAARLLPLSIKF